MFYQLCNRKIEIMFKFKKKPLHIAGKPCIIIISMYTIKGGF